MPLLEVRDLRMSFGARLIQEHIGFAVEPGTIFAIMGVVDPIKELQEALASVRY